MATRAIPWVQAYPYRGVSLIVTRHGNGWAIAHGACNAQASTLVGAFETMLGRPAGDDELRIVVNALEQDSGRRAEMSSGMP